MTNQINQPAEPPAADEAQKPSADVRNLAMLAHLSALVLFVGIPPVVGPLVVWLLKRREDPYVDYHGKEAINFNISIMIYGIVAGLAILLLVGLLLLPVVFIFWLVYVVLAAAKASDGFYYRYPFTIRFLT